MTTFDKPTFAQSLFGRLAGASAAIGATIAFVSAIAFGINHA